MKYNSINIKQLVIYLIFILSIFSSCGIFKKSMKNTKNLNEKNVQNNEVYITIDSIKSNYLNFDTFYSGFNGKFEKNGKSMPLKGIIKIKKDTFILISIRPAFGIELYKMLLEPNNIKILDKIKKEYIIIDYKYLEKKFAIDLDFKKIQSIFLNRFFVYPTGNKINNYKLEYLKNDTTLEISSKTDFYGKMIYHKLKITQNNFFLISNNFSQIGHDKYINILYSDFNKIKNVKFPQNIRIKLTENNIKYNINISYKNIKLNKTLNLNFATPNNYKTIKID